jgi:hypothetical protein
MRLSQNMLPHSDCRTRVARVAILARCSLFNLKFPLKFLLVKLCCTFGWTADANGNQPWNSLYLMRIWLVVICLVFFGNGVGMDLFGKEIRADDISTRRTKPIDQAFRDIQNGGELHISPETHVITPFYQTNLEVLREGRITAPLQLVDKTNIVISGEEGSEIYGEGPGDFLEMRNCSSVKFQNLTFRGNRPPRNADAEIGVFCVIFLRFHNKDITFENCKFLRYGDQAISHPWGVRESEYVTVRNCYFFEGGDTNTFLNGQDGSAVSGIGSHWLIESNKVENCLFGFEIESPFGACHNTVIRNNMLLGTLNIGIPIFADSGKSSDYTDIDISNNLFQGSRGYTQILIGGGERINITSNVIDKCDGYGITANTDWTPIKDVVIRSNSVYRAGFTGIQVYEFGGLTATGVRIESNSVTLAGLSGIFISGSNLTVSGNVLLDNGWQAGAYAGIQVDNTSQSVDIRGNTIANRDPRLFQDYGVWVRPGARSVLIGPNEFDANVTAAIFDETAQAQVESRITSFKVSLAPSKATGEIFAAPETSWQLQHSSDLKAWGLLHPFSTDKNGRATIDFDPQGKPLDFLRLAK